MVSKFSPRIKHKRGNIIKGIKYYYKIPYISNLSQEMKRYLKRENKELVLYNMKTVERLYNHIKDVTKKDQKSKLIYAIPYLDCEKIYVWHSRQYLPNRMKQHKYDVRDVNSTKKTALYSHFFKENHQFDFENWKFLSMRNNPKKERFWRWYTLTLINLSILDQTQIISVYFIIQYYVFIQAPAWGSKWKSAKRRQIYALEDYVWAFLSYFHKFLVYTKKVINK